MTPKEDMTPRQRCAIANPVVSDKDSATHPRHHKVSGYVQSILTFEIEDASTLGAVSESDMNRCLDGWFGKWHARVSMHPVRHVKTWPKKTTKKAELTLLTLLFDVGETDGIKFRHGSDLCSVHVEKWATHEEVRLAEKEFGHAFEEKEIDNDQT